MASLFRFVGHSVRRILVTGCGRSGTQFMAGVLSYVGLKSGHEQVYETQRCLEGDAGKIEEAWGMSHAESSWLAAPFLGSLPDDGVTILHVLRHPLKVVRCWEGHKILMGESGAAALVHRHLPECMQGDSAERAVRYWRGWNRIIDVAGKWRHNLYRFRIEELTPEWLAIVLELSGYKVRAELIREALMEGVSRKLGSCHHNEEERLTWEWMEKVKGGSELREQAREYGYVD